jgi:hypothetical protein
MYLKSLVVFVLCTLFVIGFVVVLDYVTAGVGNTSQGPSTSSAFCPPPTYSTGFSITPATLRTVNYTDELGTVNYATLTFNVNTSTGSPLTSILVCIDSYRVGTVQGPFTPDVSRMVNLTLPATISISRGMTYTLNVEGFSGGSSAWESVPVKAS